MAGVKVMGRTPDEQFLHDWVIRSLKAQFGREYQEVHINPGDEKNYELKGHYPDAVFENYGQVVMVIEVETAETVNEDEAKQWKEFSKLGAKLSVLVPKELHKNAMDICWKNGLAGKINIGSYQVEMKL